MTRSTHTFWIKLLDYELEVRKDAMSRMEDGTPLVKALAQAIKDPEVKMKFFTDPVQFRKRVTQESQQQGSSSSAGDLQTGAGAQRPRGVRRKSKRYSAAAWAAMTQQTKGAGKGKGAKGAGKGKGQGKGTKGKAQCKFATPPPDSRQMCFAFNSPNEHCAGNCGRAHVCGVCFKENSPMHSCNHGR